MVRYPATPPIAYGYTPPILRYMLPTDSLSPYAADTEIYGYAGTVEDISSFDWHPTQGNVLPYFPTSLLRMHVIFLSASCAPYALFLRASYAKSGTTVG
eukprot:2273274-Rhodomonas_salina.2